VNRRVALDAAREAVTWGKVDKEHYRRTTESFSCDYSV